jgi:hypothetical protein
MIIRPQHLLEVVALIACASGHFRASAHEIIEFVHKRIALTLVLTVDLVEPLLELLEARNDSRKCFRFMRLFVVCQRRIP